MELTIKKPRPLDSKALGVEVSEPDFDQGLASVTGMLTACQTVLSASS